MDIATIVGIALAAISVTVGGILEGANPASWISPAALVTILGGAFGAAMASYILKDSTGIVSVVMKGVMAKIHPPDEAIKDLVMFAEIARRDGLLALEEASRKVDDPFLRQGLELAVDGTDAEEIREILENDIHAMKQRHKVGAKFFTDLGTYAPTIGIMGAVIGLIHVMESLTDPAKAGEGIAAAFTATLYGVGFANVVFYPISNRLKRVSELEVHHKEMMLEGILAIQAGANPRVVEQKLLSFLPPKARDALSSDKSKAA